MVNHHHREEKYVEEQKGVSGTKNMKIDNCERSGKRGRARGLKNRECSKEH
jgi:hypothetical protein